MITGLRQSQRRGFSLIEIIIALTVLGIGMVTLLAYLPVALDAAKKSQDVTKAVLLARHQSERVRAAAFSNILNADGMDTGGNFVDDPNYPGFQYRVDVLQKGTALTKDIRVQVRWRVRGAWVSESFETAIAKYNPG